MTKKDFDNFVTEKITRCLGVLTAKGHDYAPEEEDRLSNFKLVGSRIGLQPIPIWYVYFMKHIIAIETMVKEGKLLSEDIEGRFTDAINYLLLGEALLIDETDQTSDRKNETPLESELEYRIPSGLSPQVGGDIPIGPR